YFHLYGRKIKFNTIQYSIRRYEFDAWLLKRSGVPVYQHQVKNIVRRDGHYIIDDAFRCRYLIGAGGTYCPVYRTFFKVVNPRDKLRLITALEAEFPYEIHDNECHLWFFENRLPGYSWYVPKGNNHLNIGIGGSFHKLKQNGGTIRDQWDYFVNKLQRLSLIKEIPTQPKGYNYYLRQKVRVGQIDNAYIIGDAAGLATKDMGEGIGPAVESGLLAAECILSGAPYSLRSITKSSIINILLAKYRYR
ncbi:MAG: NAD(P)/FAD-dependent oxidoreductase, partial [FCB group bacterium]|nr:NAD(P)/FAD-dependent oxidoreductase [FCB group bacterium]